MTNIFRKKRISSGYDILLTQADSVTDVMSEDTRIYDSHGIVCADFTAGGTAEIKPPPVEILRHNKRIRPCGCSWSMVKSRKPRVKNNFLWKEKATLKTYRQHNQANVSMYRRLYGNLRLWTVHELVSRLWLVIIQSIQVESGIFSIWVFLSIFWVAAWIKCLH